MFVDLVADGRDAAAALPEVAVHLAACPACARDYQGLLTAVGCEPA